MPSGNESRASWPSAPGPPAVTPSSSRIESAAVRWRVMPLRRESPDHGWQERAPARARAEPGHREDGVHLTGRPELFREPVGPDLPERGAVDAGEHERLARGPALEDPGQLEQRGGVGRAPRGVGHTVRVPAGHHHDLAPRAPGAAADHVHEVAIRMAEAVLLHLEASCVEPARHAGGGGPVAHAPGAPIRIPLDELTAVAAARRPSKSTSAARPWGSGRGRSPNENIASTMASTTGTNAAR